jgi:hypothetical protein
MLASGHGDLAVWCLIGGIMVTGARSDRDAVLLVKRLAALEAQLRNFCSHRCLHFHEPSKEDSHEPVDLADGTPPGPHR